MTLQRIQALRDLDYGQLANLAAQRGLLNCIGGGQRTTSEWIKAAPMREWSPDRLRLRLIYSIVDEELELTRNSEVERRLDETTGSRRR